LTVAANAAQMLKYSAGPRVEVQLRKSHRIDGRAVDLDGGVFKYLSEVLERLDSLSRSPTARFPLFDTVAIEHWVLVEGDLAHVAAA
jgi:hypothetical protein